MSNKYTATAFSQFSRITGRYNTLGVFVPMSGMQQRVSGDGQNIDVNTYHTKVYTTQDPISLTMSNGLQDGQLKKITFVFKGSENATATVECPALMDDFSQIVFTDVGDQVLLVWTGGNWAVLETLNITDPSIQPLLQ